MPRLFVDPSETKSLILDHLDPKIEVKEAAGLEAYTGADFVLSSMDYPWYGVWIEKHLAGGALLIQYKRGSDLASSVGTRLNSSLARMCDRVPNYWQRILLYAGIFSSDETWNTTIDGRTISNGPGKLWPAVEAGISYWGYSGGVVHHLPKQKMLGAWLTVQNNCLQKCKQFPLREFYPDPPNFEEVSLDLPETSAQGSALRTLYEVNDFRISLATIPGIGEKLANVIWNTLGGDPGTILEILTHPEEHKSKFPIPGIGRGKLNQIRAWLHLRPDEQLLKKTRHDPSSPQTP